MCKSWYIQSEFLYFIFFFWGGGGGGGGGQKRFALFHSLSRKTHTASRILVSDFDIRLQGKALRTLIDITRLAEQFNMRYQSRAWLTYQFCRLILFWKMIRFYQIILGISAGLEWFGQFKIRSLIKLSKFLKWKLIISTNTIKSNTMLRILSDMGCTYICINMNV